MTRAIALVATFAIAATLGLAGCQGRGADRLERSGQSGSAATDQGSGTGASGGTGSGASDDSRAASMDADLAAVDAMLREIDSMLAEDQQPPADAD